MAITKNKIELLDKTISVEMEMELDYYNSYWGYYYEDYYYPDYYDDNDDGWSYVKDTPDDYIISTFRYGKRLQRKQRIGWLIDMNTIYPKHIMREKKINQLLGLEYHYMYKPTLAEIFPKNKELNEN